MGDHILQLSCLLLCPTFRFMPRVALEQLHIVHLDLTKRPYLFRNEGRLVIDEPKTSWFQEVGELVVHALQLLKQLMAKKIEVRCMELCDLCMIADIKVSYF